MSRTSTVAPLLILGAALLLAGCGGAGEGRSGNGNATAPPRTSGPGAAGEATAGDRVVERVADEAGSFELEDLDLPPMDGLPERARAALEPMRDRVAALAGRGQVPAGELATGVGRLGMLYQRFELPAPALACFRAAARLAPDQPRWPYYAGYVLVGRGDLDAAARAFDRALELDPEATWTLLRLADVELERGERDRAEELYRRVLALREGAPAARYGLGRIALAAGEPERAITELERAVSAAPGATRIYHVLAQAYRRAGRNDDARRAVERVGSGEVPRHDPPVGELLAQTSGGGLGREAQLELRAGREEEGEELLRAALAEDPGDLTARYNLAATLHLSDKGGEGGRLGEAERQYREVLARDPSFTRARYGLGMLLAETGRLEAAVDELAVTVDRAPDFDRARLNLAAALSRLGRWEEAARQYEELVARDPERSEAQVLRAGALLEAGRAREAAAAFGELAEGDAGRSDRTLLRIKEAEALVAAGAPSEARQRLEAALAERPRSGELADALARLLVTAVDAGVRDPERSLEIARALYSARPAPEQARTLAMALAANGRHGEAVALLESVLAGVDGGTPRQERIRLRVEQDLERYRRGGGPGSS